MFVTYFPQSVVGMVCVENARAVSQNSSKGTVVIESNMSSETNTRVNTNAVVPQLIRKRNLDKVVNRILQQMKNL
jgi:hypothetical protein